MIKAWAECRESSINKALQTGIEAFMLFKLDHVSDDALGSKIRKYWPKVMAHYKMSTRRIRVANFLTFLQAVAFPISLYGTISIIRSAGHKESIAVTTSIIINSLVIFGFVIILTALGKNTARYFAESLFKFRGPGHRLEESFFKYKGLKHRNKLLEILITTSVLLNSFMVDIQRLVALTTKGAFNSFILPTVFFVGLFIGNASFLWFFGVRDHLSHSLANRYLTINIFAAICGLLAILFRRLRWPKNPFLEYVKEVSPSDGDLEELPQDFEFKNRAVT
jgi:hypothetical protein